MYLPTFPNDFASMIYIWLSPSYNSLVEGVFGLSTFFSPIFSVELLSSLIKLPVIIIIVMQNAKTREAISVTRMVKH